MKSDALTRAIEKVASYNPDGKRGKLFDPELLDPEVQAAYRAYIKDWRERMRYATELTRRER